MKIYIITVKQGDEPEDLVSVKGPHGTWEDVFTVKHDAQWAFMNASGNYEVGKKMFLHELDTEKN